MKLPNLPPLATTDDVRHKRKWSTSIIFALYHPALEREERKYFVNTAQTTWMDGNVLNDKFSIEQLSSNNAQHFNSSSRSSASSSSLFRCGNKQSKKKCERPSLKNFFLLGGGIFIQFRWLTALLGLIRRAGNALAPSD
jgi:hypothetical protein